MTWSNDTQNSPPRSNPAAYRAASESAALFVRPNQARLKITGADRAAWLQGLISNDVMALSPGQGCYATYLTPQGRMITDLRVLARSESFLVDLPAITVAGVFERFEMFVITEDVVVENVTASLARFSLYGPSAAQTLSETAAILGLSDLTIQGGRGSGGATSLVETLRSLSEHHSVELSESAAEPALRLLVAAARELANPGFDLYVPQEHRERFLLALSVAGAESGEPATWEVLRLEAGTPEFGRDMDQDTIPLEAGIETRAISLTKGCYVGQEVIVRVLHRGQGRVARKLVGLMQAAVDAPEVPAPGPLIDAETGRPVGRITSAAFSPRLNRWIALGYVGRDFITPGTRLLGASDDRACPLVVTDVPFAVD